MQHERAQMGEQHMKKGGETEGVFGGDKELNLALKKTKWVCHMTYIP